MFNPSYIVNCDYKNIKLCNLLQLTSSNMGTPNPNLHESLNLEIFRLELSTCAHIILNTKPLNLHKSTSWFAKQNLLDLQCNHPIEKPKTLNLHKWSSCKLLNFIVILCKMHNVKCRCNRWTTTFIVNWKGFKGMTRRSFKMKWW